MAQPKNGPLREALKAALGKDGKNSDGGDDDEASADACMAVSKIRDAPRSLRKRGFETISGGGAGGGVR